MLDPTRQFRLCQLEELESAPTVAEGHVTQVKTSVMIIEMAVVLRDLRRKTYADIGVASIANVNESGW
jgi:hypothetical protein